MADDLGIIWWERQGQSGEGGEERETTDTATDRQAEQAGLKVMFGLFAEMNVQPWDNATEFLNASSLVNESSPALWGWLLADGAPY